MQPMGQLQVFQHLHHRGTRRRSEREEIGNLFQKTMKENSPSLVKEIRHASPGSTESQARWMQRGPL